MTRIFSIPSTRAYGFTLVELVAVILLVGILAFSVAPRFLNKGQIDVNLAAQQLANDIRYTQSLAMTTGQRNRINLTATTYQITTSSGGPVTHPVTGNANPITLNGVTLSASPALPNGYIAFDSKGVPYVDVAGTTLSSTTTISLSGSGSTRTVVVAPETGRVNVP